MARRIVGVYAGTFDPVTNGHLDIIARATRVLDHLIVGVAINAGKGPLFTLEERVSMLEAEVKALRHGPECTIEVKSFRGLLVDYAAKSGASIIVRGLRAASDFEYEFQLTGMNGQLNADIETVFLMASPECQFISSRLVKEVAALGGEIGPFVSKRVRDRLIKKFASENAAE
jgi:pantetheine-phosphate adenylyltransferase